MNARRSVKELRSFNKEKSDMFLARRDSNNSDTMDLREEPKLSTSVKKRPPFPVSISAKSHRLEIFRSNFG